jgi:hypothetical protein
VPPSGAIPNAIANAIGVRIFELPATPERIIRALGKVEKYDQMTTPAAAVKTNGHNGNGSGRNGSGKTSVRSSGMAKPKAKSKASKPAPKAKKKVTARR